MDGLSLSLVQVKGKTRKALNEALLELCKCDADFSGNNGVDYLWDEAWGKKNPDKDYDEPKYSSNAEYLS